MESSIANGMSAVPESSTTAHSESRSENRDEEVAADLGSAVESVAGSATGHVTVNERIPSLRFNRYVDEKIKDWIRDHDIDRASTEYEVAFFDEESLGEVSCLVVVQSGAQLWRAWESSDNSRMALAQTIESLKLEDHGEDLSTGVVVTH